MSDLHGCPVNISYLYAMKKDEIIELLKEQIKGLRDDNNRLLVQIDALTKEVSSLKEALLQKGESLGRQQRIPRDSPNLYPTHPNGNRLPGLLCPKRRGGRQKRKKPPGVKPGRTMGPDVTCIMSWRRRNMSFIPMIPVLTSIKPGCLLPLPEYASAMNVSPCASSSTSTRYTPIRRTAACLREKHRLRLS